GLNGPSQISIAPNGDLAVANSGAGNVVVFPGASAAATPITIPAASLAIAFDNAGNLWLARPGTTGIQRYPAPYAALNQTSAQSVSSPYSIAFDKDDNLFVANAGNDTITEYSSVTYGTAPVHTASLSGVNNLTMASGALLVACTSSNSVTTYNTSLSNPQTLPSGGTCHSAVDQTYNLWLSVKTSGYVVEYRFPYVAFDIVEQAQGLSQPVSLAVYPPSP
ncbi:MAG TPA: hypothetical protein VK760_05905, partial [Candidatus Acidoferrales bacterium]|nr:hypothetical protein [Candidatus Acidoferrales bacterium]